MTMLFKNKNNIVAINHLSTSSLYTYTLLPEQIASFSFPTNVIQNACSVSFQEQYHSGIGY